jgi:hypothetical protein
MALDRKVKYIALVIVLAGVVDWIIYCVASDWLRVQAYNSGQ